MAEILQTNKGDKININVGVEDDLFLKLPEGDLHIKNCPRLHATIIEKVNYEDMFGSEKENYKEMVMFCDYGGFVLGKESTNMVSIYNVLEDRKKDLIKFFEKEFPNEVEEVNEKKDIFEVTKKTLMRLKNYVNKKKK